MSISDHDFSCLKVGEKLSLSGAVVRKDFGNWKLLSLHVKKEANKSGFKFFIEHDLVSDSLNVIRVK